MRSIFVLEKIVIDVSKITLQQQGLTQLLSKKMKRLRKTLTEWSTSTIINKATILTSTAINNQKMNTGLENLHVDD